MSVWATIQAVRALNLQGNIPLQFVGKFLTFVRAMSWCVMLFTIVWHLHPHWSVWALFWFMVILNLACWVLFTYFDVDADGAEGIG